MNKILQQKVWSNGIVSYSIRKPFQLSGRTEHALSLLVLFFLFAVIVALGAVLQ
jgi:hypothetical protein